MRKSVMIEFQLNPLELAEEFWQMNASKQVATLYELHRKFFEDPNAGKMQLAAMANQLERGGLPKKYKDSVREFVSYLYDYLVEDDL